MADLKSWMDIPLAPRIRELETWHFNDKDATFYEALEATCKEVINLQRNYARYRCIAKIHCPHEIEDIE